MAKRDDVSASVNPSLFQTDLECENTIPGHGGSALIINREAPVLVLLGAAMARMQALTEPLAAWLCTEESGVDPHEILRVSHHLAQEVRMLLDAVQGRVLAEVSHD